MIDDCILYAPITANIPSEEFNPEHAPIVLDVVGSLDSELLALSIDLAIHQAEFEQVIDFLQRRRR